MRRWTAFFRSAAVVSRGVAVFGGLAAASSAVVLSAVVLAGCATMGLRSAVDVKFSAPPDAPGRALVYVDEQYIGNLAQVVHQGLRLPEGKHRITVEKTGYQPFDTVVVSDRYPIEIQVELLELPD